MSHQLHPVLLIKKKCKAIKWSDHSLLHLSLAQDDDDNGKFETGMGTQKNQQDLPNTYLPEINIREKKKTVNKLSWLWRLLSFTAKYSFMSVESSWCPEPRFEWSWCPELRFEWSWSSKELHHWCFSTAHLVLICCHPTVLSH